MPEAPAVRIPSVDESPSTKLLPFVLALVAGSVDIIGFLGLGGLFIAHITGNLVILAAHVVAGAGAPLPLMISVPVFVAALALTRMLAAALERAGVAPLAPLLLLQVALLCAFASICAAAGPRVASNAPTMVVAGMLGVCAMAVQNALVRIGLAGAPSTAVLTTNITLLTMDLGEMLLGRDAGRVVKAHDRARRTWPAIAGFLLGCVLGAGCEAALGLRSLLLPTGVALIALALGLREKAPAISSRPWSSTMATSGKIPETGLENKPPIGPIGDALELSSPKANRLVRLVAPRTNEQQRLKAARRLANFREPH